MVGSRAGRRGHNVLSSIVHALIARQPNTRLKLAAPFGCGGHRFVNVQATRHSLSALRYAATIEGQLLQDAGRSQPFAADSHLNRQWHRQSAALRVEEP